MVLHDILPPTHMPYAFGLRIGFISATALVAIFTGWARSKDISYPLPETLNRPTPLHFGLYVTPDPENNPIDPPERFTGFHAATDFEVLPGEEGDVEVPVYTICHGPVAFSGFVEGYGGLLIQRCTIQKEEVTVLYGHLRIAGLPAEKKSLKSGTQIGYLATGRTYDSGGNRKHLHLGIHKGSRLDFRGYVPTEQQLDQYINPMDILPAFVDTPGTGEITK